MSVRGLTEPHTRAKEGCCWNARTGMSWLDKQSFKIPDALGFLAEFTQQIPLKGAHLIRYYRWYSNKARGMWCRQAEA